MEVNDADLDFDLDFLDGFHLDDLPDLCFGDKESACGLGSGDLDFHVAGRESSPDDGGDMSSYVTDLERFLLEDNQEAKQIAADVEPSSAADELSTDDYFFGDFFFVGDVEPSAAGNDFAANNYHLLGGYFQPATPGQDLFLLADHYDLAVPDEPIVDDAASATEDAGEDDEATSSSRRKRASLMQSEAEPRILAGRGCRSHRRLLPCAMVCLSA